MPRYPGALEANKNKEAETGEQSPVARKPRTAPDEEILTRVATDPKWHNRMTAVTVEQYQKTIAEGAE